MISPLSSFPLKSIEDFLKKINEQTITKVSEIEEIHGLLGKVVIGSKEHDVIQLSIKDAIEEMCKHSNLATLMKQRIATERLVYETIKRAFKEATANDTSEQPLSIEEYSTKLLPDINDIMQNILHGYQSDFDLEHALLLKRDAPKERIKEILKLINATESAIRRVTEWDLYLQENM